MCARGLVIAIGASVVLCSVIIWATRDILKLSFEPVAGRVVPEEERVVGGDRDAHGCIGSAGYRWCEPKAKCMRFWEESCYTAEEQGIAVAFANKYKKPVEYIKVTVDILDGDFARGGVKFAPTGPETPGGYYLAKRVKGVWVIAYDGNGEIPCKALAPYGFPEEIRGDCVE